MTGVRGTRAWRELSKQVCREEPICWLQLKGCTYRSTTGDHVIPIEQRPDLALVRTNVRGACLHCNTSRQDKPAPGTSQPPAPALGIFD